LRRQPVEQPAEPGRSPRAHLETCPPARRPTPAHALPDQAHLRHAHAGCGEPPGWISRQLGHTTVEIIRTSAAETVRRRHGSRSA